MGWAWSDSQFALQSLCAALILKGVPLQVAGRQVMRNEEYIVKMPPIVFLYCAGFVFLTAGFIVDGFNSPQQHSAFSPLGIALYVVGAIVFAIGLVSMVKSRKR